MGGRVDQESFFWMEEYDEHLSHPVNNLKRKARSKRIKFVGWGSKPLIEFLQSIGKDTTQQISRYDVTDIIINYVNENKLVDSIKKKRIVSDKRLFSLFGKKSFLRIKIFELLEAHYAEDQLESDDDFLFSSEEDGNLESSEQKSKKTPLKKFCSETPKSCWAAIIPNNIKLLYLKRCLVQSLLKDSENFDSKIVGSFVRVKSDPNDYLQKNSHQLLQVTGTKLVPGTDGKSTEILLQVSNFVKDIQISTLSDDNFTEEECEDLRQRVKDGLLKRPTVMELEEKALILHEDITRHKLIDRANEKGWRKELLEYLERRQLLQTPAEQERLLHEIPQIIADEELEATPLDSPDIMEKGNRGSLVPIPKGASDAPFCDIAISPSTESVENGLPHEVVAENEPHFEFSVKNVPNVLALKLQKQPIDKRESNVVAPLVDTEENLIAGRLVGKQVIDLSDDEENEDVKDNETELRSLGWHYTDPQGDVQGPFSITSLKRWWDDDYFPSNFKVWKIGEGQERAVFLRDVLEGLFLI